MVSGLQQRPHRINNSAIPTPANQELGSEKKRSRNSEDHVGRQTAEDLAELLAATNAVSKCATPKETIGTLHRLLHALIESRLVAQDSKTALSATILTEFLNNKPGTLSQLSSSPSPIIDEAVLVSTQLESIAFGRSEMESANVAEKGRQGTDGAWMHQRMREDLHCKHLLTLAVTGCSYEKSAGEFALTIASDFPVPKRLRRLAVLFLELAQSHCGLLRDRKKESLWFRFCSAATE
ncbi:MAG: hypothetical protein AAF483_28370, partial [Planctomycetota bacterium]